MGNTNSTVEFEHHVAAAKDYKPLKKVSDKYLGDVTFLKSTKSDDIILKKEIDAHDSETYQRKIEEYSFHFSLKHRNLAKIYAYTGGDNNDIFRDNSTKIYIYFEHFPNSLESTLKQRRIQLPQNSKRIFSAPTKTGFFEEAEIFDLTLQLVDVLEYLQQHSVSHGELRPGSIFLANDKTVKLVNRKIVCDGESAYEKVKNRDPDIYLTPLAFESVGRRQPEPFQNKYKADMFSLGMTLLECATLKKSSQIYDWNNFTVNSHLLSGRLVEMRQKYTQVFCNIVQEMLQLDEDKRKDFLQLKQYITEEKRLNTTIITSNLSSHRHLLEDEDFFLKDFILNMDAKTKKKPSVPALQQKKAVPAVKQKSFVRKPTINIESAQVEYKEIVGDTPVATTKGSITEIGDSVLRTFREEEYDEGAAKKNLNIKVQQTFNNQDINKVTENSAKKTLVTQPEEPEDSANLTSDRGEGNGSFSPSASPIRTSPIKVRDLLLRNPDHVSNNFQFNFEKLAIHEGADSKLEEGEHQYSPPQTIHKKNGDDNSGLITDDSFFTRRTQVDYASQRNYEADTSIGGKKDSVSVSKIIQEALARAQRCRDSVNKTRDRPSIPRNPASNFNSNRTQISHYTGGNESPPQYNSLRGYSVERRSMTEADSPPHRTSSQNPAVASLLNKYTQNSSQRMETVPDYKSYETPGYASLTKSSTQKQFGLPLPIPSNRTDISYSSANRVNTDQDYARAESPVPYARINLSVKRSMSAARDRPANQKPLDLNTILEQYRKEDDASGAGTYKSTHVYETPQRILKTENSTTTANHGLKLNISREEKSVAGNSTVESTAVKTQPDSSGRLQPSSFSYRQINVEIEERIRRAIERTNHTRELVKRQESNSPTKIAQSINFGTEADNAVISLTKCEE